MYKYRLDCKIRLYSWEHGQFCFLGLPAHWIAVASSGLQLTSWTEGWKLFCCTTPVRDSENVTEHFTPTWAPATAGSEGSYLELLGHRFSRNCVVKISNMPLYGQYYTGHWRDREQSVQMGPKARRYTLWSLAIPNWNYTDHVTSCERDILL